MSSSHAAFGAAADERKARLAKLRSLKRKAPEDEDISLDPDTERPDPARTSPLPPTSKATSPRPPEMEKDVTRLYLSGRNYDPETKGPKLGFDAPPTLAQEKLTLEEQAADLEEDVRKKREEDEKADKGIDLFKLQPKKPNWDLKRELARKMEVLSVRTDNAIAKLVRERLAAKKAAAVAAAAGKAGVGSGGDAESAGLDGVELVEGVRLREQEERDEERRERDDEDLA